MGSKIQFVSTNKDQTSPTAVVVTYSIRVVTRWLVGENRLLDDYLFNISDYPECFSGSKSPH